MLRGTKSVNVRKLFHSGANSNSKGQSEVICGRNFATSNQVRNSNSIGANRRNVRQEFFNFNSVAIRLNLLQEFYISAVQISKIASFKRMMTFICNI